MELDVIAHPSAPGLKARAEQLARDRAALIWQLEREQLLPVSPPPPPRLRLEVD